MPIAAESPPRPAPTMITLVLYDGAIRSGGRSKMSTYVVHVLEDIEFHEFDAIARFACI